MASFDLKPERMDVMGFLADHMGHFSLYDIPNLLFAIVVATLLGYGLARWGFRMQGDDPRTSALWAASAALAAGLVRSQLPLAIVLLSFVLLVRGGESSNRDRVALFAALVLGLGCGGGAALVTGVVTVPFCLVVRWAFAPQGKA